MRCFAHPFPPNAYRTIDDQQARLPGINFKVHYMWTTQSLWFEIAIVSIIFALGNILMGHFEERTPKLRRVAKYVFTVALVCGISLFFGRPVAMVVLGLSFMPVLYVHGYYLPTKKGINGWTGEPKGRYYDFRKWSKDIFSGQ